MCMQSPAIGSCVHDEKSPCGLGHVDSYPTQFAYLFEAERRLSKE